ncbi:WD domain protein [Paramarasmius palmivorus]|uniref:WD domain protein n=1 Tax=Paramarasmius palmivorus TaxID=297713 RepID=A0AAW0E5D4_9AGAR
MDVDEPQNPIQTPDKPVNGVEGAVENKQEEVPRPDPEPTQEQDFKLRYILSGHDRAISALKFSHSGAFLASSGADKQIKIWDAFTGDILRTLRGHTEGVSDIAWSSDDEYIASASDDKSIKIWNMELGVESKALLGHTSFVFCVNYNKRSNLLVSGGFDETVRVWDVARGKVLKVLPAHSDPVTAVGFNHDGTLIVSCAMDGLIRIWDSDSGQCLKTLVDDDNPIWFVHFNMSLPIVSSTSLAHMFVFLQTRDLSWYRPRIQLFDSGIINNRDANTKNKYIVSGSEDNKAYIWDLQTRKVIQVLEGHRDVVLAVATHPTQDIIATASMEKDPSVRLWWHTSIFPKDETK